MTTGTLKRSHLLLTRRQLKRILMEKYGVTCLGVFGSVAKDEATETSDVDVLVEMPPICLRWCILKSTCRKHLQVAVDLVRYRPHMNDFLKQRIDQETIHVQHIDFYCFWGILK